MIDDPTKVSYLPARSYGWAWLLGLIALLMLPVLMFTPPSALEGEDTAGAWIGVVIMVPLVTFLVLTLISLPNMRYTLTSDALVLSCGWMLTYRLPYEQITEVRRATLTPSLWSSMRLPGLALWGVPYADAGTLYMCATRMSRDLLVITAGTRRYGITPAEEDAFVGALTSRLPRRRAGVASNEGGIGSGSTYARSDRT
jgi:hypothetical protein